MFLLKPELTPSLSITICTPELEHLLDPIPCTKIIITSTQHDQYENTVPKNKSDM